MPAGLHRTYGAHHLHFITGSCHRRLPFLSSARSRDRFLSIMRRECCTHLCASDHGTRPSHSTRRAGHPLFISRPANSKAGPPADRAILRTMNAGSCPDNPAKPKLRRLPHPFALFWRRVGPCTGADACSTSAYTRAGRALYTSSCSFNFAILRLVRAKRLKN